MGRVGQVACQGFLVREARVGVLVAGAGFLSLDCNEVSSREFGGVYGFCMALGSPAFNVQCCVPVLLKN